MDDVEDDAEEETNKVLEELQLSQMAGVKSAGSGQVGAPAKASAVSAQPAAESAAATAQEDELMKRFEAL